MENIVIPVDSICLLCLTSSIIIISKLIYFNVNIIALKWINPDCAKSGYELKGQFNIGVNGEWFVQRFELSRTVWHLGLN